MKSAGTARFWQRNPLHPSLRFKKLRGFDDRWSVRIGADYRAPARVNGDTVEWYRIGSHQDYNKLV